MATTFDDLLKELHGGAGVTLQDTEESGNIIVDSKRQFIVPEKYNTVLAFEGDVNSQIVTFEIPRYHENHDLSKCTYKYVRWKNLGNNIEDWSELKEEEQSSDTQNSDIQILKWIVPSAAFLKSGTLEIAIILYDIDNNKSIAFSWNSSVYSGFTVAESLSQVKTYPTISYFPSKNEILTIQEETHNIVAPSNYNYLVANYGDLNCSSIYFEIPKTVGGIDVSRDTTTITIDILIGGHSASCDASDPFPLFAEGTPGIETMVFKWEIPQSITQNTAEYFGTFSIVITLDNGETGIRHKVWKTSPFDGLKIGKSFEYTPEIAFPDGFLNIINGNSSSFDLTSREIPGLVQLRTAVEEQGSTTVIMPHEMMPVYDSSLQLKDVVIGQENNGYVNEAQSVSGMIERNFDLPKLTYIGNANQDIYDDTLNFNTNHELLKRGRYTGVMTPSKAEGFGAPPILATVYFILETIPYNDGHLVQTFLGITDPANKLYSGQVVKYIRTRTILDKIEIWTDWVEEISVGNTVAKYLSVQNLGNGNDLYNNLSSDFKNGKEMTPSDETAINASLLNFNTNEKLKNSGIYKGLMNFSLVSYLGAPPVKYNTYFTLETTRYSEEHKANHWIIQRFIGIYPPQADFPGQPVEYIRTFYTETVDGKNVSQWTNWWEIHTDYSNYISRVYYISGIDSLERLISDLRSINTLEKAVNIRLGEYNLVINKDFRIPAYSRGTLSIGENTASLFFIGQNLDLYIAYKWYDTWTCRKI